MMQRVKRIPKDNLYRMASWEQREYENLVKAEDAERERIWSEWKDLIRGDIGQHPVKFAVVLLGIAWMFVMLLFRPEIIGAVIIGAIIINVVLALIKFIPKLYMYYFNKIFRS